MNQLPLLSVANLQTQALGVGERSGNQALAALGPEFESLFFSMVLKELRTSLSEGEGLFSGEGSDIYGGMFDLYLGQSLAAEEPLGLMRSLQAQKIYRGEAAAETKSEKSEPPSPAKVDQGA